MMIKADDNLELDESLVRLFVSCIKVRADINPHLTEDAVIWRWDKNGIYPHNFRLREGDVIEHEVCFCDLIEV